MHDSEVSRSDEVRWEELRVPAGTHTIPVRLYRPEPFRYGWLVWAPGGSWQAASVEQWHETSAELARISRCTVASVGYRLAPRHRHPAQLEDVLTVMGWARDRAAREGSAPAVSVGGDSAGGTLAASAALVWRDRGEPLAAQVLAYPPLDPSCAAPSYTRVPDAFPSAPRMLAAWRMYRGDRPVTHRRGERLPSTPLEADRFDGLAPAIIAVGDLDPVLDDVTAYARRLDEAGNEVMLRTFARTPHAAILRDSVPAGYGLSVRQWLGTVLRIHLAQHVPNPSGH
ncbi:alpha/beta hydrolase [Streptomyces radiopugnans]|uniref:alpha/beta hydrolase n=1 Tax=Streptomyces radiopugnans TaxID=403935 RepID=UPI003F1C11C8